MARKLKATQVGDPVIRLQLKEVSLKDIPSTLVAECIAYMREVNDLMKGVGISANQVGYDLRISLIHVKKTKNRPDAVEQPEILMINPEITHTPAATEFMWEGCLSVAEAGLFAKVKRFKRVTVKYLNLESKVVEQKLDGLLAHIAQHEIDHLNGKIFLDNQHDTSSYMSASEYRKMRKTERIKK